MVAKKKQIWEVVFFTMKRMFSRRNLDPWLENPRAAPASHRWPWHWAPWCLSSVVCPPVSVQSAWWRDPSPMVDLPNHHKVTIGRCMEGKLIYSTTWISSTAIFLGGIVNSRRDCRCSFFWRSAKRSVSGRHTQHSLISTYIQYISIESTWSLQFGNCFLRQKERYKTQTLLSTNA